MNALASQLPVEERRLRSDGAATRARMLDAAVTCILENGYYEASSNAIARRAGVTWGAIQHQFGTRQRLLLAVLEDRWRRLTDRIAVAEVSGNTLEQRLACVMAVLEAHYGSPEHLVVTQIMIDLIQSPATSEATKRAVEEHGRELTRVWRPLFSKALGEAAKDEDLVRYAFLTIRGYLSAGTMAARLAPQRPDGAIRTLLLRGIACAIRERAAEAGLGIGDPALRSSAWPITCRLHPKGRWTTSCTSATTIVIFPAAGGSRSARCSSTGRRPARSRAA
jgi:AcrR family transcriptional regulator